LEIATPHLRYQSSLESVLDFGVKHHQLDPASRALARSRFYAIVDHFSNLPRDPVNQGYSRELLARYTHDYSLSDLSRDLFLRPFLTHFSLSIKGDDDFDIQDIQDATTEAKLRTLLAEFSDHLLYNFFFARFVS
jgi:hypothetical protein